MTAVRVRTPEESLLWLAGRYLDAIRQRDDARAIAIDLEQQLAAAESVIEADTTQPNGGTA